MKDKILCPYCGPWNGHPDGVEMEHKNGAYGKFAVDYYGCNVCQAHSPMFLEKEGNFSENADRARTAAMHRFAPQLETTRLLRKYSRPGVYADLWLHCEKCEGKVDDRHKYKYCPECGLKVAHQDE